jgi:hypothetical protein
MWSGLSRELFCLVAGMIECRWEQRLWRVIRGVFISEVQEPVPVGGGRAPWLARRAGAWWIGEPPH